MLTPLPAEPVSYPDKEDLKKPSLHPVASIDTRNYEDYLIAKSEGDLGKQEKAHLEQFLKKNPEVAKEAFVYAKLKLAANKSITYHNKESLKKRPLLVHLQRKAVVYGVAASVLLLIGMLWLIPRTAGKTHPVNTVATYAATTIYHENHPMQPALRHAAKPAFTPEVTPIREKQQPVNVMAGLRSPEQFHVSYTAGNMYKRLDHTSNYFYHQIREDLEYYVALQEYSKKSVLGKVSVPGRKQDSC
ncbi:MAG: hypothetical protein U5L09_04940 [Bacteroidales bacterium]|nr:hypothetical protein [Bacteroidales bacterium]